MTHTSHASVALARRKASSAGISVARPSRRSLSRLSASITQRPRFSSAEGASRLNRSFSASRALSSRPRFITSASISSKLLDIPADSSLRQGSTIETLVESTAFYCRIGKRPRQPAALLHSAMWRHLMFRMDNAFWQIASTPGKAGSRWSPRPIFNAKLNRAPTH